MGNMEEKRGLDILNDARLNKGTAFTHEERIHYGLQGLLPPRISTIEHQVERALANIRRQEDDIDKYLSLSALQKRNERLFYRLLIEHIDELMPIVYTPTVGQACQEFAQLFTQTSGCYLSLQEKGQLVEIMRNWPVKDVRLIVVTDGERILGLGDLGTNGMGIPIGKLALYCALAGIKPEHCMPIVLDVGSNNESLREETTYLGLRQERTRGDTYLEFIDEFVHAVQRLWPHALLQFEDFATNNAIELLARYRNQLLCFNDDIQGTAAVVLSGLYASTRITNLPLAKMRFMFVGAGSAASGIGDLLVEALVQEGVERSAAYQQLIYFDRKGLVRKSRGELPAHIQHFASDFDDWSMLEAIQQFKPHALIGATGVPHIFTQELISEMAKVNEQPVIFALSNPTSRAECTAEQAYAWTDGRAVFSSGSPFRAVHINGDIKVPGQGNNAYVFPGLGLGALESQASQIDDEMLITAASSLAACVSEKQLDYGCLYPPLKEIREVSLSIAMAVAKCAERKGLTNKPLDDNFEQHLRNIQYWPDY
jgi:malate dehydrogenase (oxaloacetate-decarboxylating)(NADP+)